MLKYRTEVVSEQITKLFFKLVSIRMATAEHPRVYDVLVDLLARTIPSDELLTFRLSDENQRKLEELLERNRAGEISPDESAELDAFEHLEHIVRLLKACVRQKAQS